MFATRLNRLNDALKSAGLDAVALNPGPSLTYLTGLHLHLMERPTVAIFPREGKPVLVLPELEAGKASQLPYEVQVFTFGDNPAGWAGVYRQAANASRLDGKIIGVEPVRMRVLELRILEEALPAARFPSAESTLASLRLVKDAAELVLMRQAAQIARTALEATLPLIRVGMTERQLASELTMQLMRAGSDPELPFSPIVASGPNSPNPHAVPSDRALRPGDLVIVDWGAAVQDYFSDLTRVLAVGEIEPEFARIVRATIDANAAGRAAARPGIPIGEVDRAARSVIESAGYGPYFIHRTGHGLGMEAHEEPYAFGGNPLVLEPGMVFTVEPGIYLPGRAGARIEDDIAINLNGCRKPERHAPRADPGMSRDLLLVVLSLFTWGVGEGLFMYFQPLYLQQRGADPLAIGAILGLMGVAMMVTQAPAGYLADRFGRRPIMWGSWILGALAAWVMALASSLTGFVAGMLLYGLTSFAIAPMNSYITGARGKWSVARALTVASGAFQIGAVIGPLAGGQIGQRYGLKTVYLIAACVFLVSVGIILLTRRQAIVPHEEAGERQGHLLQDRRFVGFLAIMFLTMFATYLPQPLTPNYLQNQHHLSLVAIGQLGSIGSLGNAVLALGLGHLRAGVGFMIGQAAVAIFSLMLWRGSGFGWYAVGYFFFGGYRVCRLMAVALTRPLVRKTEVGLAYGLLETVNCGSVILAPVVAGFLYDLDPIWIYPVSLVLLAISLGSSAWFLFASRHAASFLPETAEEGDIVQVVPEAEWAFAEEPAEE